MHQLANHQALHRTCAWLHPLYSGHIDPLGATSLPFDTDFALQLLTLIAAACAEERCVA